MIISTPGVVSIEIPVLDKQVVEPPKQVVHEGTIKITTLPNAEILLDSQRVATGSYEAKIKSGGHTLRVVAGGMRPYQSEVVVGDDETRTIDVPLEPEPVAIQAPVGPPPEDLPSFEAAVALGAGVKLRGDHPLITIVRPEIAFRFGRRTNFGLFVEIGDIDHSGACGFDMPGPMPATPYDFGAHNRFEKCMYVMPGLQLIVHVLPHSALDPYVGFTPGFRFGFVDFTSYLGGVQGAHTSEVFPAVFAGLRGGVDYRPRGPKDSWQVGGYLEAAVTVYGEEAAKDQGYNDKGQTYLNIIGGLRTSVTW